MSTSKPVIIFENYYNSVVLGIFKDNIELLKNSINYLQKI